MRTRVLLVLVFALACGGCVDVRETWTLKHGGGGTLGCEIRWNAGLWRQVRDALGAQVMRLAGSALPPLTKAAVRESLDGVPGLALDRLEEGTTARGWQHVTWRVSFERLDALGGWEFFRRRPCELRVGPKRRSAHFRSHPFRHLPWVDAWLQLDAAVQADAKQPDAARAAQLDTLRRVLRVPSDRAERVLSLLRPHKQALRFACTVHVPGDVVGADGEVLTPAVQHVAMALDAKALVRPPAGAAGPKADRVVRAAWRMSSLDERGTWVQRGDLVEAYVGAQPKR